MTDLPDKHDRSNTGAAGHMDIQRPDGYLHYHVRRGGVADIDDAIRRLTEHVKTDRYWAGCRPLTVTIKLLKDGNEI